MTGGISAIKGFEYQATVILDRIFDHFAVNGSSARVRPEGDDDLNLSWSDANGVQRSFAQIKKPREDASGRRTPRPWSISEVAGELMPDAVRRLSGNRHRQLWVLGDDVSADVQALISTGSRAPALAPQAYWGLLQAMARARSLAGQDASHRRSLGQWSVPVLSADPAVALVELAQAFEAALNGRGLSALGPTHTAELTRLHASVPVVLDRISLEATYGLEDVVRRRVEDRLQADYQLARPVIEKTLFRNLIGFIQDISKQSGRDFDQAEFELELRTVWPLMSPVRDPTGLPVDHVARPDLVHDVVDGPGLVELVGVSGAGKSTLMAETAVALSHQPWRRVVTVEAGPSDTLRDVLAGVAFHLRRFGHVLPFAEVVDRSRATDEVLESVTAAMSAIAEEIWLLVDFAEGRAGERFAAELSGLVRQRSLGTTRLLLFAQQRVLTTLSGAEQSMLGVEAVDIRGFSFEEFALLAELHGHDDRAALYEIHQRLSAGRTAGVSPQLASALAHLGSTEDMRQIAERPADERLAEAERLRFGRMSSLAAQASERLVCFTLPFTLDDAEAAFPDDNVGAAIAELLQLGLLRRRNDHFEMHEQVRAGLETMLSRKTRTEAHAALATWADRRGLVGARIHHLQRAGLEAEAEAAARALFLDGKAWDVLAAFVAEKRLVTAAEAVEAAFAGDGLSSWQLAGVLHRLGDASTVDDLMRRAERGGLALLSDHNRGRVLIETIVALDSERLPALMAMILDAGGASEKRDDALVWLVLANRQGQRLLSEAMSFIEGRSVEDQRALIDFLWRDGRRAALSLAFKLDADQPKTRTERRHRMGPRLRLADQSDVAELLAALPLPQVGLMLARRSVMLERHADLLWRHRLELSVHAPTLCASPDAEDAVRAQALRVLIFLGHADLEVLTGNLFGVGKLLNAMAMVSPALAPGAFSITQLETRIDDQSLEWPSRVLAAQALIVRGGRALKLRHRLMIGCPFPDSLRDLLLLGVGPLDVADAQALAMLDDLIHGTVPPPVGTLVTAVLELADAEGSGIDLFLAKLCSFQTHEIAVAAAIALGARRDRAALPSLVAALASETDPVRAQMLAPTVAACGAQTVRELDSVARGAGISAWRCIVAGRSADASAGDELVSIALNETLDWQVRRAAIRAAGRLPYSAALDRIAPSILSKPIPVVFDDYKLRGHQALIDLIWLGVLDVLGTPAGQPAFGKDLRQILERRWGDQLPKALVQPLADWLISRLQSESWPYESAVAAGLLNELHLPMLHAATLRALARCGQLAPIEQHLKASTVLWQAQKSLIALAKIPPFDESQKNHLEALLDQSAFAGDAMLLRVIESCAGGPRSWPVQKKGVSAPVMDVADLPAAAAVTFLAGAVLQADDAAVLKVTEVDADACERLIALASPALDPEKGIVAYKPDLTLTAGGEGLVSSSRAYSSSTEGGNARDRVRAAIAAANTWNLAMPWHEAKISSQHSGDYPRLYLQALAARGEAARFYDALDRFEPFLIPVLCARGGVGAIAPALDERLLPALLRHVHAGDATMFAGLCALTRHISGPAADPLLLALFNRWLDYFPPAGLSGLDDQSADIWIGFRDLSDHPRFGEIPRWRTGLERVLAVDLTPYRTETLLRLMARDRRSYVAIETQFLKLTEWEDYGLDRVDELDVMCDELWRDV